MQNSELSSSPQSHAWFCLRVQPRHEHIAQAHLLQRGNPVFNPRIRFQRVTRQGRVSVTESLFPGYVFAQLPLEPNLAKIRYLPGVRDIVHFGRRWPTVPAEVIAELQAVVSPDKIHEIPAELSGGDRVKVAEGAFQGLSAVVSRVMPARERVVILLQFLGQQTMVEMPSSNVIKEQSQRSFLQRDS